MKLFVFLTLLTTFVAIATAANVVCYFESWTIYRTGNGKFAAENVDPTLCTHIIYAFVGLNANGTVHVLDDWEMTGLQELDHLMSLKDDNPDLKILVSMGGYNEGSLTYSTVAADPDLRAVMVEDVVAFIDDHGFDGFDIYWVSPGQGDGDPVNDPANFVTWLGELKEALSAKDYILSAAVAGLAYNIDISYPDGAALTDNIDMLQVMSFEYHGTWEEKAGQNAPLYASSLDTTESELQQNVAAGIQHWIDIGADPAKIHMGIGPFGKTFTLADESNSDLYAPITGAGEVGPYTGEEGYLSYNEICELYADEEPIWDDEQKVPYLVVGDQWIGYDNVESVQLKIELANELGLGGAMIWSLDRDDFLGICGDPYPILTAVNQGLNRTVGTA